MHGSLIKVILVYYIFAIYSPLLRAADDSHDKCLPENLKQRLERNNNVAEFSVAKILLEQNFTDGDVEVVIFAKGGDIGLKQFCLVSPKGKVIYKFQAPDNGASVGGRELVIESSEPAGTITVLNAYPEGRYSFVAKTFNGDYLFSQSDLDHHIPAPVSIRYPLKESEISRNDFDIAWVSEVSASKFLVELRHEETKEKLSVEVSARQNSFRVPEEWLVPGVEYQLGVGVVSQSGNITFVEQSVYTATE